MTSAQSAATYTIIMFQSVTSFGLVIILFLVMVPVARQRLSKDGLRWARRQLASSADAMCFLSSKLRSGTLLLLQSSNLQSLILTMTVLYCLPVAQATQPALTFTDSHVSRMCTCLANSWIYPNRQGGSLATAGIALFFSIVKFSLHNAPGTRNECRTAGIVVAKGVDERDSCNGAVTDTEFMRLESTNGGNMFNVDSNLEPSDYALPSSPARFAGGDDYADLKVCLDQFTPAHVSNYTSLTSAFINWPQGIMQHGTAQQAAVGKYDNNRKVFTVTNSYHYNFNRPLAYRSSAFPSCFRKWFITPNFQEERKV